MTTPSSQTDARPVPEQVADFIKQTTYSPDGKPNFPDGFDPAIAYAGETELRRRATQAWGNKTHKQNLELQAENKTILEKAEIPLNLSEARQAELETLKTENPDQWLVEVNKERTNAKTAFTETVKSLSTKRVEADELERNANALAKFVEANPELGITEDYLKYDLPQRILAIDDIDEKLAAIKAYKETGTVVQKADDTLGQPNMNKAGGSDSPGKDGTQPAFNYKDAIL